ncbi:MAG TPA: hypothetical protein VLJ76_08800 [Gaiellaceae bacterium]|nr:hypothetical protein [Gaiellaceae bacterium]
MSRVRIVVAFLALAVAASVAVPGPGASTPKTLPGLMIGKAPWPANDGSTLRARLKDIGLDALPVEGLKLHIHVHLDIVIDGRVLNGLPALIGINIPQQFITELHTHDTSGIIHVESPKIRKFTLGEFFDVWGLRFSSKCLGGYCAAGAKHIWVWVNAKRVLTDPRAIVLKSHQEIVVAYGTAASIKIPGPIPAAYPFPKGY